MNDETITLLREIRSLLRMQCIRERLDKPWYPPTPTQELLREIIEKDEIAVFGPEYEEAVQWDREEAEERSKQLYSTPVSEESTPGTSQWKKWRQRIWSMIAPGSTNANGNDQ